MSYDCHYWREPKQQAKSIKEPQKAEEELGSGSETHRNEKAMEGLIFWLRNIFSANLLI